MTKCSARRARLRRHTPSLESLEDRRLLTTVGGSIVTDTAWTLEESPYEVTSDVTVRENATLVIEPGVVIHFDEGTDLEIEGHLIAEGTPQQRITFDRAPGEPRWDGLKFENSLADNRVSYADMRYGDGQGEAIDVDESRLLLDNITWTGTRGTILELDHPSLIVRNSHFPTSNGGEVIHGEKISGDEYLIIENNLFENSNNGGDVIDFLGAERPGPVLQILNNVFMGGGDDGLDLDGTDAHIEGNLFMNFRKNTGRNTTSNAIATGLPQNGDDNRTEVTIVRNIFVNNDHALLLKEDAFATIQNNVFVGSNRAVIQFNEVGGTAVKGAGKGAAIRGNIFAENNQLFKNLIDTAGFTTQLTIDDSWLPNEVVEFGDNNINAHDLGEGNLSGDPLFVDPASIDFRLRPESPARGQGPMNLDMGAYVEAGPVIVQAIGDDDSDAIFRVGGPGITHYRYRLNGGDYAALRSVELPIELTEVSTDDQQIDVVGMNSAGEWSVPTAPAFGNSTRIISPQRIRVGESLPIVVQHRDWQDRMNPTTTELLEFNNSEQLSAVSLQMKKGVASFAPVVTATDDFELLLPQQESTRRIEVLSANFPTEEHTGTLEQSTAWSADIERHITSDLVIPANVTLTIEPGTRILLAEKVNVIVEGRLMSRGTSSDPIVFNSLNQAAPWGGIVVSDGEGQLENTFFTNGGADSSRKFGHSNSQPLLMTQNATLDCDSCYVINNVGKAFGARNSFVHIDNSVISDVDTGGEFSRSVAEIQNTWLKNISDGERDSFVDDDNDGFYFSGAHTSGTPSRFAHSYVIDTKDDGLDHNGANLVIESAWIQGAYHEGIASSNKNFVEISDSVFIGNNQGVEAGYGSPNLNISQSVITGNRNDIDPGNPITAGLRFGDSYDGRNGDYEGQITAEYLVLSDNGDNVRNHDGSIPGPKAGAIEITQSLTNDVDYSANGNLAGIPVFGPAMHLLRASAGFADGPDGLPLGRVIHPTSFVFSPASPADFNGDGVLSADDIDLLCGKMGSEDAEFDLNSDGIVDDSDRDMMVFDYLNSTYGDANLDGIFNSSDFVYVFQRGKYEDQTPSNAGWADGDWNCDGKFSSQDLVLALQTGDYSEAAAISAALDALDEWEEKRERIVRRA